MKNLALRIAVGLLSVLSIAYLSGCSGFDDAKFPPASTNPEQVDLGPINGSVFGGHAPLVGAHIYLLQASTSDYGAPAVSLLNANSTNTSANFPVAVNTNDPIIPTYGNYYYETTDASGSFNLSGDYTCTTGSNGVPGPPVYIYAYGGTPAAIQSSNVRAASQVVVSGITGSGSTEKATYTFTIATGAALTAGEIVSLAGFTGTPAALLNGQSAPVLSTPAPTATTFALTLPDPNGEYSGAFSLTGAVTAEPNFNPAVVNVAVLGDCPSTKNFAGSIKFVYMNEVSTVAAAYALSGFTSSTLADVNALNIGASSTNLQGILTAGSNANQLYDIQGSVVGTGTNGEGHIARLTTPVGAGTVSQSLIDTLADTLAACVDSGETVTTTSTTCTTLFNTATADGTAAGVKPVDTATAALNIAHNPYSAVANYASTLYNLGTANPPFVPKLAAAPANFTVSIAYTGGGQGASIGQAPHSVAVDGSGNIWTASFANTISEFSPLGVPAVAGGYTGEGLNAPTSVTVDAGSNFVWVANYGPNANATNISVFTTGGQGYAQYTPGGIALQDIAFDSSGNAWVSGAINNQLDELSSGGTVLHQVSNDLYNPDALAIQTGTAGDVFLPNGNDAVVSVFTQPAAFLGYIEGRDVNTGLGVAIDSAGKIWTSTLAGSVSVFTLTGDTVTGANYATGTANGSFRNPGGDGIAIDGANSVWVTSPSTGTIYQLSNTGANLSGTAGYSLSNAGGSAGNPDGIAIDGSGNVWYNTTSDTTLRELVGAATPVVTPIAAAVKNNTLGKMP